MKLTFGKFNGWDTNDLAKAGTDGRSYLAWGAKKLQSPLWRDECGKALAADVKMDINLAARAKSVSDGITFDEAYQFIMEDLEFEKEEAAEQAEWEAARDVIFQKHATLLGITVKEAHQVAAKVERIGGGGWESLRPSQFSSQQRFAGTVQMMKELERAGL